MGETLIQAAEGARYDMGDPARNTVADMIEAAAAHLGATVFWHDPKKVTLRCHATLTLDKEEVCVEATSKRGAVIASDDNSRYWEYHTSDKLATAVKRRMRAAKERDAEQQRRWEARREQERIEADVRARTKEDLIALFGKDLVDAAITIDAFFDAGTHTATPQINVYVGRKIDGQKLTFAEAVMFIQTMRMGGYDLVKLAEETNK